MNRTYEKLAADRVYSMLVIEEALDECKKLSAMLLTRNYIGKASHEKRLINRTITRLRDALDNLRNDPPSEATGEEVSPE